MQKTRHCLLIIFFSYVILFFVPPKQYHISIRLSFFVLSMLFVLSNTCELTYAKDITLMASSRKTLPIDALWSASGWMPDGESFSFKSDYDENCHSGDTCFHVEYETIRKEWVGVCWLPVNKSWKGPGVNLYDYFAKEESPEFRGTQSSEPETSSGIRSALPTDKIDKTITVALKFWARGGQGREIVKFQVGIDRQRDVARDSVSPPVKSIQKLTQKWEQYQIDLLGMNLSSVVGGFCFFIKKAENPGRDRVELYLDDIRFETR